MRPETSSDVDLVGVLRFVDCVAARDRMERDRGVDQFSERRRVLLFCAQGKASNAAVIVLIHRAHAEYERRNK